MSAIHLIESFEISSEVMIDTVIFKLHLGFVRASKYVRHWHEKIFDVDKVL